jgi:murein L,D-transpeptidase YafK
MAGNLRIRRLMLLGVAGAALTIAACTDVSSIPKHLRPLPNALRVAIEEKGMEETAPILIRIFKEESVLEVWKKEQDSPRYALLTTYDICKWSGDLGPKKAEGDRQAPEGFYTITPAQMNPKSSYYLSFNLGYPNAYDRSLGRTGAHLMVHGACSSRGCYSMDDEQIQEIYSLARLAFQGGQRDFQVQAFPFRMTPDNMAKHRNDENIAFWRMLKEGYDHFEVIRQPPKVDVCSQRYVFNAVPQEGVAFNPTGACPPMTVPPEIAVRVAEKEAQDDAQTAVLVARLEAQEDRRRARGEPEPEPEVMIAEAPAEPAEAAPAPMSVAAALPDLTPPAPRARPEAPEPEVAAAAASGPVFLSVPETTASLAEAAPAEEPAQDELAARMQAESAPVATAYIQPAPDRSRLGSFFGRVIDTVNPF